MSIRPSVNEFQRRHTHARLNLSRLVGHLLTQQPNFLFEETIVHIQRAALRSVTGIFCGMILASCGGGGYGGGSSMNPAAMVSVTVNPAAITLGQSAVVTWS